MDIYSEVEQSNLTVNKKSGSAAYSEQGAKKGLEMQFKHWKETLLKHKLKNSRRSCETEDSTEVPW